MDLVEFWIWEHATKHAMSKVLKRMTSLFFYCDVPNSWLTAQLFRRVKEEWDLPEMLQKITYKEMASVQECLSSIFKHHRKDLKHTIKTIDFIKLDLGCKAAFLALRLEASDLRIWKITRDEMFPNWNEQLWMKVKKTYSLKNDIFFEEYKKGFLEVKSKLQQRNCKQTVLDLFAIQMKKSFPLLIAFLLRIKLSVLERIKIQEEKMIIPSCNLDSDIQFLPALLKKGIHDEIQVLNLWEEVQRRKLKKRTQYDLMILRAAKTSESSTIGTFHAVPPKPDTFDQPSLSLPLCFTLNPCMPTSYTKRNREGQLEEIEIDKSIPRDLNGMAAFNPFWFSSGTMTPKQERIEVELRDVRERNLANIEVGKKIVHFEPATKKMCQQIEPELTERKIPCETPESISLVCRTHCSNQISNSIQSTGIGHNEVEKSSEGYRIVPKLLKRLEEQSQLLSKRSNDANNHCMELNRCMNRILLIHKTTGNEENEKRKEKSTDLRTSADRNA